MLWRKYSGFSWRVTMCGKIKDYWGFIRCICWAFKLLVHDLPLPEPNKLAPTFCSGNDGQKMVTCHYYKTVVCVDPSTEYYIIRWGPESCGHNHAKPMEKIISQVVFWQQYCHYQIIHSTSSHAFLGLWGMWRTKPYSHIVVFPDPGELHHPSSLAVFL